MLVTSVWAAENAPAAGEGGETHGEVVHNQGEHGGGAFPPFDPSTFPSQILWLAITFGLFYLFLKRTALPRIGNILEVRRDRIAQDLDQAAQMKDEADAAVAAYERELAEAKAKGNAIGQQARDRAKAEAEEERRAVTAGLDKKLAEAEARIAGIKADALKDVDTIAEETAAEIVQALVGGSADKAKVAAAVKAVRN